MNKKISSIILILSMLMAVMPVITIAETTWTLDDDGTLTISDEGAMEDYAASQAPWFKNRESITNGVIESGVTVIGYNTFYGCSNLTSVTIPNSVTTIGNGAFYNCSSLTSVTIPDGVTSIGAHAFKGCSSLENVVIPDSLTEVSNGIFENCSSLLYISVSENNENFSSVDGVLFNKDKTTLVSYASGKTDEEYIIPDSVTTICEGAFSGCSSLTSVTIPEGVTSIGMEAFYNCSGLTSVTIPSSVTSIGNYTFSGCESLTDVYISSTDWWIGNHGNFNSNPMVYAGNIYADGVFVKNLIIPDGITEIKTSVFNGWTCLESVTIPNSVTSISNYAFNGCSSLTDVYYNGNFADFIKILDDQPDTSFGSAKLHCNDVTAKKWGKCGADVSYFLKDDGTLTIRGTGNMSSSSFRSDADIKSVVIENGVTSIDSEAFYNCSDLTNITIPGSVVSVGYNAFYNSGYYKNSSNWDNGVLYVGDVLAAVKTNIKSECAIKDGTRLIADNVFSGCREFTSIIIPESVTSIGEYVFSGCESLTDVYISSTDWWIEHYDNFNSSPMVYADNIYADGALIKNLIIPNGITEIKTSAFERWTCLESVTIPESVTSIGNYAFYNCSGLTGITIPDKVTSIGEGTFHGCSGLSSVNLGSGIKNIGANAFDGCDSLTDIHYNDTFAKYQEVYVDNTGNAPFIKATKHYKSDSPVPPDPIEQTSVIINVEPTRGTAGNEITVPIRIKNNPGISSFSVKVNYDITQLVPMSITKNPNLPGSITSNIEQLGNYTGLEYVTAVWSNASDYSEDGDLFYITFKVYSTIKKGTYIPINISSTGNIVNQDYEEITALLKNGSVVIDFIYGDIYGDGVLDNKDLVRMRQYLADWDITLTDEEKQAADVYADGTINNKDLVRLSQYFAGWNVKLGK